MGQNYEIDAGRVASVGPNVMAICLVPRIGGNLNRTIATVDMSNMTVSQVDWYYNDGGHIIMRQQFALVGGTLMVVHQDIDIATPSLRVAVAADLGNYSIQRSEAAMSFARPTIDR